MEFKIQYFRSITFLVACVMLVISCAGDPSTSNESTNTESVYTKTVPPADFMKAYEATPGATMIDVRTKKEYQAGRVVPNAINVDYHGDNFITDILEYDRTEPIFIYCFSGGRSSKAAFKMRQVGFDRIYELKGGYQQWEKENKK